MIAGHLQELFQGLAPYLAQFPLEHVLRDVQRLFYLALAFAEVAPAVENFG